MNSHELSLRGFPVLRVYQFHHPGNETAFGSQLAVATQYLDNLYALVTPLRFARR